MRAADNGALSGLTEDLRQPDSGHHLASDEIGKQVARPHRRQLVWIAHQHQAAVPLKGIQQGGHQRHVYHRGLIHDDSVCLEGCVGIFCKDQPAGVGVKARLQQPVDGRRLCSAQLTQPLGRPPRRGRQGGL